ncbi:unnamed protein product [Lupinus luteus]|uniref:Uncharacterized protein n=1 Tax=Lupinus luteus TaxID=3873 RepID=A0AAV1WBY2_LUPLU
MDEERKQGLTKNKGKQKKPKFELTDSSHQGIRSQKNHESVRENRFTVRYQNERIVFQ